MDSGCTTIVLSLSSGLMAEFQDVEDAKILMDKIKTKHKIMNNVAELSAMI